jgi:hypothetical protein
MAVQEIEDFVKNYKHEYDKFIITIYPHSEQENEMIWTITSKKIKKQKNILKTIYSHECIFRDTRISEYKSGLSNVERIRKFAFYDNNKWIYIITFITTVGINDIPLITKYHDEKHIIQDIISENENFNIANITDNNLNTLQTKKYLVITLKENLILSNELLKSVLLAI